jgi:hypothetical protein
MGRHLVPVLVDPIHDADWLVHFVLPHAPMSRRPPRRTSTSIGPCSTGAAGRNKRARAELWSADGCAVRVPSVRRIGPRDRRAGLPRAPQVPCVSAAVSSSSDQVCLARLSATPEPSSPCLAFGLLLLVGPQCRSLAHGSSHLQVRQCQFQRPAGRRGGSAVLGQPCGCD